MLAPSNRLRWPWFHPIIVGAIVLLSTAICGISTSRAAGSFDGVYDGSYRLSGLVNDPRCAAWDTYNGRIQVVIAADHLYKTLSSALFSIDLSFDGEFTASSIGKGLTVQLTGHITGRSMVLDWHSPNCHFHASLERPDEVATGATSDTNAVAPEPPARSTTSMLSPVKPAGAVTKPSHPVATESVRQKAVPGGVVKMITTRSDRQTRLAYELLVNRVKLRLSEVSLQHYRLTVNDVDLEQMDGFPQFQGIYQDTTHSYVLLEEGTGGTACPALYRVIDISGKRPSLTSQFGSCSDQPTAMLVDGGLRVTTPKSGDASSQTVLVHDGQIEKCQSLDSNTCGTRPFNPTEWVKPVAAGSLPSTAGSPPTPASVLPRATEPPSEAISYDDGGPEAFLRKLYEPYKEPGRLSDLGDARADRNARDRLLEASLIALWKRSASIKRDGPGPIDGDPVCSCQEADLSDLHISVRVVNPNEFVGIASFNVGKRPTVLIYQLVKVNNQWRIRDIMSSDDALSLRQTLEQDVAKYGHDQAASTASGSPTPAASKNVATDYTLSTPPRSGLSHFPGEQLLPRELAGPDELAKVLYGNRLTANYLTNCGTAPCTVRVVANQIFNDQGGKQTGILVTAAEPTPSNVDHARGAVIGMAWLSHTNKGWALDLGSPDVITDGAFGRAPDVTIINGGIWGKAVVLQHSDMHQGEGDRVWELFVPDKKRGTFVLELSLQTERESSGACPVSPATATCLKDDFSTTLNLVTEQDGLSVVATVSYPTVLHKPASSKTYHITTASLGNPQPTTTQAAATTDSAAALAPEAPVRPNGATADHGVGAGSGAGSIPHIQSGDILPLRRGFYVADPTPCEKASNATLELFTGKSFGLGCRIASLSHSEPDNGYKFLAGCKNGGVWWTVTPRTGEMFVLRFEDTVHTYHYCTQSSLPYPWSTNDLTSIGLPLGEPSPIVTRSSAAMGGAATSSQPTISDPDKAAAAEARMEATSSSQGTPGIIGWIVAPVGLLGIFMFLGGGAWLRFSETSHNKSLATKVGGIGLVITLGALAIIHFYGSDGEEYKRPKMPPSSD